MKKDSLIEYSAYWLARGFGLVVITLPPKVNFILAKVIGISGYYLLKKKRRLALKNLKLAFGKTRGYRQLETLAKKAFVSLALDLIETLYIPRIDSRYINRHIRIENLKFLDEGLARGRGVILLAYHLGNWELANITCGLQGYTYRVIVNEQRYPLLNSLLNRYRESKGCKTIPRGIALREVLKALKNNEVVAMVGDQGGRDGYLSGLFGLPTSTPSGFVRFALRSQATIVPAVIVRERRFSHRIILEKPILPDEAKDEQANIEGCLRESNAVLERYISEYPQEYFWFYKIWKYSPFRNVLVLSDGKSGHLRQAQAVLKTVYSLQFTVYSAIIEVRFRNRLAELLARVCAWLDIDIWEYCLSPGTWDVLRMSPADLVVSCGSSLAGLNLYCARQNLARSICLMNPGGPMVKRFDLVIMAEHDRPPSRKNVIRTSGALNLIDDDYLKGQAEKIKNDVFTSRPCIGLLIGGDTKRYKLDPSDMRRITEELKKASGELGLDILVTTSRRTPGEIEDLVKDAFRDFPSCRLLVIANEKNIPEAVGGILALSDFVLVSGESISMVSEAASSGKYAGVFRLKRRSLFKKTRHEAFLRNLESRGYIYIIETGQIYNRIKEILSLRPQAKRLDDRGLLREAVRKLL